MCGRVAIFFKEAGEPRYNVAPTSSQQIIVHSKGDNVDEIPDTKLQEMKWGFQLQTMIINLRDDSNSFKKLRDTSRCIVPVNAFYEWQTTNGKKQPWCVQSDEDKFYMAGVFQKLQGEYHFLIMTTDVSKELTFLHNRMPALIPKDKVAEYLNPDLKFSDIKYLIKPESHGYKWFPVSSYVGNTKNQGPECIKPIKLPSKQQTLMQSFRSSKSPIKSTKDDLLGHEMKNEVLLKELGKSSIDKTAGSQEIIEISEDEHFSQATLQNTQEKTNSHSTPNTKTKRLPPASPVPTAKRLKNQTKISSYFSPPSKTKDQV